MAIVGVWKVKYLEVLLVLSMTDFCRLTDVKCKDFYIGKWYNQTVCVRTQESIGEIQLLSFSCKNEWIT